MKEIIKQASAPHPLPPDAFEPLPASEKNAEFIAMESKTFLQDAWRNFRRNKLALISLCFIILMCLMAIFVPILSPYTYDGMDSSALNQLPTLQHWFGTDKFGRDIFVRVMFGARISLAVGFAAAGINMVIGIVYGGIAGYIGGKADLIMMRVVDMLYSIPNLLYIILIMLIFGSNMFSVLLGICISSWVGMARLVRTQVMSLKEQEFSLAAFVMGASKSRILFKHLIINSIGPIIVSLTLMVPSAIFQESFLGFVGIGISAPMSSWGTLANDARLVINSYPLQIVWPVLSICLTMLALNFLGDGLGEALDPKKR
ncbi:ABC transporter permease [Pseudoflavonifractor intestinihominis]|uniref:ABC transporter permease n=1 Tax=Pseudoflavonifractor intestinihominis TaxID=3133171 RepID=A0ABV1E8S3_9FIRM|nr:ABC transporter permease [uncultured Pseudoflavonifractor sp.]